MEALETLTRFPDPIPTAFRRRLWRREFGLWAEFELADAGTDGAHVVQRLRWIPPGRFVMGSPKAEEGRYDHEGPQHEVTVRRRGFWLFDTPCTQALWQAVMGGDNPSRFQMRQTGRSSR